MMNWSRHVCSLQFDITSHCNARCGACVRNKDGDEVRAEVSLDHFDVDLWNRIASEDTRGWFIKDLTLNGNWGDPMMHPKLVEMLDTFAHYHPEAELYLHTNGSMRTEKFWNDLATSCRKFANHVVVFAVDGLEDTHSIYRRKTNFNKIVDNIKAFTANKGRANVTMTQFEHNKHQVKEVEALAEECGAIMFNLRESHADKMHIELGADSYDIVSSDATEPYNKIFEASDNTSLSDTRDYNIMVEAKQFIEERGIHPDSKCPWYMDRQVQIDPWGIVWPCCHLSLFGLDIPEHDILKDADESLYRARDENNLHNDSLTSILQNEWWEETLSDAVEKAEWNQCRKTCGICAD